LIVIKLSQKQVVSYRKYSESSVYLYNKYNILQKIYCWWWQFATNYLCI